MYLKTVAAEQQARHLYSPNRKAISIFDGSQRNGAMTAWFQEYTASATWPACVYLGFGGGPGGFRQPSFRC